MTKDRISECKHDKDIQPNLNNQRLCQKMTKDRISECKHDKEIQPNLHNQRLCQKMTKDRISECKQCNLVMKQNIPNNFI